MHINVFILNSAKGLVRNLQGVGGGGGEGGGKWRRVITFEPLKKEGRERKKAVPRGGSHKFTLM